VRSKVLWQWLQSQRSSLSCILLFHMFYPWCLQCKRKPFLGNSYIFKAFSFVDPFVSNVLSFIILIIDPTFSLATFAISKAFNFVSSTVEPTLFFASPTLSWTFSVVSSIFCYTIPKNLTIAFYFNCSKIELVLKSYSFWTASYWASYFPTSSSFCGFSFDVPNVEVAWSLTWH